MSDLPAFSYFRPRTLRAALQAIARPGACIYAGGTDVIVALSTQQPWTRFVREIVDIKGVTDATGVSDLGTHLRIGALVTAHELSSHPLVRRHARALAEAAAQTSAPALRRRATVGGNITTPHAAGDITTALRALDAMVVVADRQSCDHSPLADFMSAQAAEWPLQRLVVAVHVPKCRHSAFEKVGARMAFSRSLAAAGVAEFSGGVRVALGGLGERPFLAPTVAATLGDRTGRDEALRAVCHVHADSLSDYAYRLRVAGVVLGRAVAGVGAR